MYVSNIETDVLLACITTKSPVTPFSRKNWTKYVQCAHSWVNLQTTENVIAENAIVAYKLTLDKIEDLPAILDITESVVCSSPTKSILQEHSRGEKMQQKTGKVYINLF